MKQTRKDGAPAVLAATCPALRPIRRRQAGGAVYGFSGFGFSEFRLQDLSAPPGGADLAPPLITSRTAQLPVAGQFPTIRHCRSNRFTFLSLESRTSFLTGGERGVTSSGRRGSGPCRPQRADTPWELRPADRFRQWFSLFPGPRSRGLRKDIRGRSAGFR